MDPDATLREIRAITNRGARLGGLDEDEIERLLELWAALDEWLSRGGFPPRDWKPTPTLRFCGRSAGHPAHLWLSARQLVQCPGSRAG